MLNRWNTYLKILNITLLPYQHKLVDRLLKFPSNAKITQCRQSGKSFILGLLAYFLAYTLHWDIVITAPKIEQTKYIMKVCRRIHERIRAKTYDRNKYSIDMVNRGSIQCLSGSEVANVEGASAHLVIIDEHQDIQSAHAAEVFLPMLSWHNGLYWSAGIGSLPGSVATRDVDMEWILPWQDVVKVKPDYNTLLDIARKEQLPEVFKCHYECMPMDTSGVLLIPSMNTYTDKLEGGHVRIGIDYGKRVDQSVATVVNIQDKLAYITEWLVPNGTYDEQMDQLVYWLKNKVDYDEVISEDVGVGDVATDYLIKGMKDPRGFSSGIQSHGVSSKWKSRQSQLVHKMAGNRTLLYNPDHEISGAFYKDITSLGYKMLDSNIIKPDHSDFLSSLILAIEPPSVAYL